MFAGVGSSSSSVVVSRIQFDSTQQSKEKSLPDNACMHETHPRGAAPRSLPPHQPNQCHLWRGFVYAGGITGLDTYPHRLLRPGIVYFHPSPKQPSTVPLPTRETTVTAVHSSLTARCCCSTAVLHLCGTYCVGPIFGNSSRRRFCVCCRWWLDRPLVLRIYLAGRLGSLRLDPPHYPLHTCSHIDLTTSLRTTSRLQTVVDDIPVL